MKNYDKPVITVNYISLDILTQSNPDPIEEKSVDRDARNFWI